MDCPHCGKAFHDSWAEVPATIQGAKQWHMRIAVCPACSSETIELRRWTHKGNQWQPDGTSVRAYPSTTFRRPTPKEVPADVRADYEEACKTLPISSKASAALARRCLQAVLRAHGYRQRDLSHQIDALLNEADPKKAIPTGLRDTVDAIRNFGNFSAHPVTDQTTLQVIDVEPGEAEWCLDILDEMFDHYYVKPAQAAARKQALNRYPSGEGRLF